MSDSFPPSRSQLLNEIQQCAIELREAAILLRLAADLPGTASIYEAAARRAQETYDNASAGATADNASAGGDKSLLFPDYGRREPR